MQLSMQLWIPGGALQTNVTMEDDGKGSFKLWLSG